MMARIGLWAALALSGALVGAPVAWAGNAIGPAVHVGAEVVTTYELDQRILLMQVLNQPGDVPALARKSLIDDRLRHAAAKALGVSVTDEQIQAGMTEFAARGQLTLDQLFQLLQKAGIDPQALRDFVTSGLEWRGAVRAKFLGKVVVTEAEIDRAIGAGVAAGGELQVLLAEIFLPDGSDQGDPTVLAQRIKDQAVSPSSFSVAAQKYSKADSAKGGGLLDWTVLSTLPPAAANAIAGLRPGEISDPVREAGGLRLYLLRDESETAGDRPLRFDVDYAVMAFAPGQEAAMQALAAQVSGCDELYPAARGLPEEVLQRQTDAEAALPASYAALLARMDPGETSTALSTAAAPRLVMLCDRVPQSAVPASRDAVKTQLLNRKIALLAEGWLEQMRQDTLIRDE
jgi:peptidyl-prolyl cis-trans isomerase SurA